MELQSVKVPTPNGVQLILAQSHLIKTVEDVHEYLVNCTLQVKFGIAFCEASGLFLVGHSGNEDQLEGLALRVLLDLPPS